MAYEPVGVFDATDLPWMSLGPEISASSGRSGELQMLGHCLAFVPGRAVKKPVYAAGDGSGPAESRCSDALIWPNDLALLV